LRAIQSQKIEVRYVERASIRPYLGAVGALLSRMPLQVGFYRDRIVERALSTAVAESGPFDVALFQLIRTYPVLRQYVERNFSGTTALDYIDCLSETYSQKSRGARSRLLK